MAKTIGSVTEAQSATKKFQVKRMVRTAFAAALSLGLASTFALPAYANKAADAAPLASSTAPQTLETVDLAEPELRLAALSVTEDWELIEAERIETERIEAERLEEERAEAERVQAQEQEQQTQQVQAAVDIPSGAGGAGLLSAALAQLGSQQDCTALVERGLSALGYAPGDLGTGIWQYDGFGARVGLDSLAPGDILVYGNASSGAHVAVYAGNGLAVHSGFPGGTVTAGVHAAWEPLTGAIRPN